MMVMDSLNHRLDSLVDRMNRTSGNQKVQAMAAVINELVSQRKAMQERMHHMMEHGEMKDEAEQESRPKAKSESGLTDSTDHSAHHP
jgi:predicted transcriptional regulator